MDEKSYYHEVDRIHQFKAKARDDKHFRQSILNRASKCGPEKRRRFIQVLRKMGQHELAGFVKLTFS